MLRRRRKMRSWEPSAISALTGHNGREGFYHTWWPRGPKELNTQEFREELGVVVDNLRKGVSKGPLLHAPVLLWQRGGY